MKEERVRESYDRLLAIRASGETDRSNCLTPENLQDLLDRKGLDDDRLRRLDHVMACPFCLPEFELLRSVARAKPKSSGPWITALAAAVTLLIGGTAVWRIEALRRHTVSRGDEGGVAVVSPAENIAVAPPPSFAWHPVADAAGYRVELRTLAGDIVWQWTGKDTATSVPAGVLPNTAADYRWAVVAELANGERVRSNMQHLRLAAP